jgi:RNA polymerase sigma factor (TIGR02999 family)
MKFLPYWKAQTAEGKPQGNSAILARHNMPAESSIAGSGGTLSAQPSELAIAELYVELRKIAASYLRTERHGHTLQPTALVNEAYLRLSSLNRIEWSNRSLVLGLAAGIMRRILVSHARRRRTLKRAMPPVSIALRPAGSEGQVCDALTLHAALTRMESGHAAAAKVIELRFFGGLTEEESAEFLGLSRATVQRHYTFARAWLLRDLGGAPTRSK